MNTPFQLLVTCSMLAFVTLAIAPATTALAQETDDDKKEVKVEMRNGEKRVWINGEEVDADDPRVKELEMSDGPNVRRKKIVMKGDGDVDWEGGIAPKVWLDGDDENVFVIDGDDGFAFGFGEVMGPHMRARRHHMEMADPEIREMERQSRKLAREIRDAEGNERTKLERELNNKLDTLFDKKLDKQTEELAKLREKVAELEKELAQRRSSKSQIVDTRKKQLLGEQDALRW